jgi:hypothetical protein
LNSSETFLTQKEKHPDPKIRDNIEFTSYTVSAQVPGQLSIQSQSSIPQVPPRQVYHLPRFNARDGIEVNVNHNEHSAREKANQMRVSPHLVSAYSQLNNLPPHNSTEGDGTNTAVPTNQIVHTETEEAEEIEEEMEEESEESDEHSSCTSFSDLYVIDEKEEARLKQIALERFLKD